MRSGEHDTATAGTETEFRSDQAQDQRVPLFSCSTLTAAIFWDGAMSMIEALSPRCASLALIDVNGRVMFKQTTARDGMMHFANLADHQSGFSESFNFPELDAVASMHRGERPVALKADSADLAAASVPNNDREAILCFCYNHSTLLVALEMVIG
jgi:hypothetical protein